MSNHFATIATSLSLSEGQVKAVIALLDEGATIPFISRYRKEKTGSLDEVAITSIRDGIVKLRELDKRREAILKSMQDQGVLTPELNKKINEAESLSILEDNYLPFKPKRRTKATIAKEKGLEPLAKTLFSQSILDAEEEANKYLSDEKEVKTIEEALQGARYIIAEWVSEDQVAREKTRKSFKDKGVVGTKVLKSKKDDKEAAKYKDYFEWDEPVKNIPSHRMLAMRRGEKEGFLVMDISPDQDQAIYDLKNLFVKGSNAAAKQVELAVEDGYKRLLKPSIETEVRLELKKKADEEAIIVFAENARELLMAAPLGQKSVLAIDPGFRTGCKVVALDENGKLLEYQTIFPNEPQKQVGAAEAIVKGLVEKYKLEAVAIGNGTASRETEQFVKGIGLDNAVAVVMVNESGASIYSASEVARDEFPDQDVTVRGSVSIGRRLMDPLAELVKIDPKSIGVGQYQHDVDQTKLKGALDETVMSSVNAVGVEVNTASKQLLTYVSGLGPVLAQNIIDYRDENGSIKTKAELKKVPRMGEKAFEQAAGFIRVGNASNPLDASSVHPESYHIVKKMAKDLGVDIQDLMNKDELRKKLNLNSYVTEDVGLPTLNDIMGELAKPGRDPRAQFEAFTFQDGVNEVSDLKMGMVLPGIVTNVTNFGAFVDIGVHQDGLVHISQLADRFVDDPKKVVKVSQKVKVKVLEVDIERKRISLTMKLGEAPAPKPKKEKKKESSSDNASYDDKLAMLKSRFK